MARTPLNINSLIGAPTGIAPATEVGLDPTNGNVVPGIHDHLWLEATCTVAGPVNITFVTQTTVGGHSVSDDIVPMSGAGTKRRFGPFDRDVYGNDLYIDGPVTITVAVYQTTLQ